MLGNGIHQVFVGVGWCAGGIQTVHRSNTSRRTQHWNVEYSPDSECDNFLMVGKIFNNRSLTV